MKLQDLYENSIADLQIAIDNQLVMLGGDEDIVIISDVPSISEKQYKRLYRMSFKGETHRIWILTGMYKMRSIYHQPSIQ